MNQLRHSGSHKKPPGQAQREVGPLDEATIYATSNALLLQTGLISALNGPGMLPSQMQPSTSARWFDPHSSMLASRQISPFWSAQEQAISQSPSQLLQVLLQQQQQQQQQAFMAAEIASLRVAALPALTTNIYGSQISALDGTMEARAQLATRALRTSQAMLPIDSLDSSLPPFGLASRNTADEIPFGNQQQTLPCYSSASRLADPSSDDDDEDLPLADTSFSVLKEKFPFKLYRLLDEADKNGDHNIISFFPHGKAFAIHKPRAFVAEIMPKYFTTNRMSSFQRQLNFYGFQRILEGRNKGGYFHSCFRQGRKDLCKQIRRKKITVRTLPVATEESDEGASPYAASSIALSQVNVAQSSQQSHSQRHYYATTIQNVPRSTTNSLFWSFGESLPPATFTSEAVFEPSRSTTTSLKQNRSDFLAASLPTQGTNLPESDNAETEDDKNDGDQSEDSD